MPDDDRIVVVDCHLCGDGYDFLADCAPEGQFTCDDCLRLVKARA